MAEILFLDETTLKAKVPSSRNVTDTQTIFYSIRQAQSTLKNVLGRDFYFDLVVKYEALVNSGVSFSACENELFYDYIQDIVALETYKRLIDHLSYKLRDGGLRASIDDNSELAQSQDRGMIQKNIIGDINGIIVDMKNYIYDNSGCFPLYNQGYEGIIPPSNSLNIGKILGKI